MPIQLSIVTPDKDALAEECDEVVVPGIRGELGLLAGHVPLITAVRPGVLTVVHGTKKTFYAVSSGFAEVDGDNVSVLTSACEVSSEIDVERARRAKSNAEAKLSELGPEDVEQVDQQHRLSRAQARIDATERSS